MIAVQGGCGLSNDFLTCRRLVDHRKKIARLQPMGEFVDPMQDVQIRHATNQAMIDKSHPTSQNSTNSLEQSEQMSWIRRRCNF